MTGSTDVLETLISYGADLDAVNDEHTTPLFFACQCSNQYAAHVLLTHGANIRAKNLQGKFVSKICFSKLTTNSV